MNSRVQLAQFTWIHQILWTNLMCRHAFTVNSRVFHVMTCTSETVPVLTQYDSCQTRSRLMTTSRTRVYTWKHVLVERYQLRTSMTPANWFRNGSLFAGKYCVWPSDLLSCVVVVVQAALGSGLYVLKTYRDSVEPYMKDPVGFPRIQVITHSLHRSSQSVVVFRGQKVGTTSPSSVN